MTFLSELFVFDRKRSFCEKSDEDIFVENECKTSMVDIAFQSQELIRNFFGGVPFDLSVWNEKTKIGDDFPNSDINQNNCYVFDFFKVSKNIEH